VTPFDTIVDDVIRTEATSRRDHILAAVVQTIIEIGYTDMTVGDVARRAGISTSLVHYHFESKSALIVAALRAALDDDTSWRSVIAAGQGGSAARLEQLLCGSLPGHPEGDASWVLWIETWGEARRNADIKALMTEQIEHERRIVVELLVGGAAAGEFSCPDPAATAARLMALRDGLAVEHALFAEDAPAADMVARLRVALAAELGPPDPAHTPPAERP
jgi:AcrR family transcriptional regulator